MVRSLYFQCYYAYLLGNLADASMYLDMLREEFPAGGGLKQHQLAELVKIRESVRTGNVTRNVWIEQPDGLQPPIEKPEVGQDELVRALHESGALPRALGGNVRLINVEQPCPPYGRVDMVYQRGDTVHPVEVKTGRGGHDILGQIGKYDLYHRLHLHYGHYEFVKSVTVCRSYDDFALASLKGVGITPLAYAPDPLEVRYA